MIGALLRLLAPCLLLADAAPVLLFRDAREPLESRLDDLVSRLSQAELIGQLAGPAVAGLPRLNVSGAAFMGECLAGLGAVNVSTSWPMPVALAASFDEGLLASVSSAMASEARAHHSAFGAWKPGPGGDLPPYGRGWDSTCLVPQLNIYRDPRWGRNYETLGESPLVISRLGSAVIRGLQGCESKAACEALAARGGAMKLAAVAKHAFAYNLECFGPNRYPTCGWSRHSFDAVVSTRDLNTSYLRQWRDAVGAGLSGAMCAYNSVGGVPACANSQLLRDRMRRDWGFGGMVISDAGAVDGVWGCDKTNPVLHDRACHNYTHDAVDATSAALTAGCDLNYGSAYASHLATAVAGGRVSMDAIKASVKNVFRPRLITQMEASLTDPATIPGGDAYARIDFGVVDSAEHRELARAAAAQSTVLLTNHHSTLPLAASGGGKATVALIGEHTGGDWSAPIRDGCFHFNGTVCTPFWQVVPAEVLGGAYRGTPSKIDSLLESFRSRKLSVGHALGVKTGCAPSACNGAHCPAFNASCATRHGVINQTERIAEAVKAAQNADVVVVTLVPASAGESHDRETIALPAVEAEMLSAVAQACQSARRRRLASPNAALLTGSGAKDCRLVSVLFGDGSLSDPRIWRHSDAIVHAGMAGQGGGEGVTRVLLGEVNPSAALPMTIYHQNFTTQNDFIDHSFMATPGRGARFLREEPAFRFGHSLSYTTWSETVTRVSPRVLNLPSIAANLSVEVEIEVANTGVVAGDRVVLLSLRRKGGGTEAVAEPWPVRWLADFSKVKAVGAGEKRSLTLGISVEEGWGQWVTRLGDAAGEYELLLGTSDEPSPLTIELSLSARAAAPLSLPSKPSSADARSCDVTSYGALGDGASDSTQAIQKALDACAGSPGAPGQVIVPRGAKSYRSGSLRLRSHQRLLVEEGAMLQGLTESSRYPEGAPFPSFCGTDSGTAPDCRGSCMLPLLGAEGVTDVAILGGGVIDGGSPTGKFRGPRLIQFRNSSKVHISNVTAQHSAFWTIHFYGCSDISVTDSTILAGITVGETDGVDVDSTVGAYIARNHIEVGDDGVALKSGMGACGRRFGRPTANVLIENNFFNFSGGVAIGSEMSGGVRNVTVQHNVLRGDSHNQPDLWTWGPRVLTIKSDRGRGGVVEDVLVFNTTCIDCDQIARITMRSSAPAMLSRVATPIVRNVTVRLVRGTCEEPGFFQGLPEAPLEMNFIDVVVTPLRKLDEFGGNASAGYANCSAVSPVGIGLRNSPPVCSLGPHPRHLPDVYGGPAAGAGSDLLGPNEFPSGALFAFSGIDGQSDTPSRMMGWFSDHAYSVYLWLKEARLLELGFTNEPNCVRNCSVNADPAQDRVVFATNDALLVERGSSRLGVTWRDMHTIVGFVEGPLAQASLRGGAPNCGGDNSVVSFHLPKPVSARQLRWLITQSADGFGPTVCFVSLLIDGKWTTSREWSVTAVSHPNGPVENILKTTNCSSGTFWNADKGKGNGLTPWNLTLDMKAAVKVAGFRYGIHDSSEMPKSFVLETRPGLETTPWQPALSVPDTATAGNCSALSKQSTSASSSEVLAFATHLTDSHYGVTQFALCYSAISSRAPTAAATAAATSCATAAAQEDVAEVFEQRNEYISSTLPPLPDAGDDRFQRKLLSVMKVNSLAAEGAIRQSWSTTCRAPHQDMFLWDGMMQTLSMNHVDPWLSLEYLRSFIQFQDSSSGSMCSQFGPSGCLSRTDAMPPNMALTVADWYKQVGETAGKQILSELFPHLEKYIEWDLKNRRDASGPYRHLLFWHGAYEAGMDHEQTFCPGKRGDLIQGCRSDHYAVDFTSYIIWECEALAQIATELGLSDRAAYWNTTAAATTDALLTHLWDPATGFFYDRYFNGTMMNIKTVAGFYPLLASKIPAVQVKGMVAMLKAKDFATAVPVPTVGIFTPDFSSDLDRGPMWEQQNLYIIRGLRKYGYDAEADALKRVSLEVVRHYYEQWGTVFEFYDALNSTDPTQTLRKPAKADSGPCKPGVMGLQGHCGTGGIRDYNFCAGLALLWLRGGE